MPTKPYLSLRRTDGADFLPSYAEKTVRTWVSLMNAMSKDIARKENKSYAPLQLGPITWNLPEHSIVPEDMKRPKKGSLWKRNAVPAPFSSKDEAEMALDITPDIVRICDVGNVKEVVTRGTMSLGDAHMLWGKEWPKDDVEILTLGGTNPKKPHAWAFFSEFLKYYDPL